ncbi:uncharacterized protein LOC141601764 [Silene latifolia]|uniref:uncharacterized protein LOC141601764 n=1 Tax=Silene latifolia TaxID=37657 RepID=UPI003D77577B
MDNIGCWNVRGMNKVAKQLEIKRFLYQNNVGLYGLVETKIKVQDCSGVLATFGHPGKGHITATVTEIASGTTFFFTTVYGSNDETEILSLWADLKRIKDVYSGPWAICGDFNNLLDVNERIGRPVLWSDIEDFRDCVSYCEVMDVKAQGSFFTWNNKHEPSTRVFSRLDRFMVNSDWLNVFPDCYAYFLPEGLFDHNPCVITKQQKLKGPLKQLNRNRFSDVEKVVEIAKLRLLDLQTAMHRDPTNLATLEVESIAADEFRHLTKAHFSYLSQKAKVAWNKSLQINDKDGKCHRDPQGIEQAFLDYYSNLLGVNAPTTPVHFPTVRVGNLINAHHTSILLKPVSPKEVKACIFSIPSTKSPGPDGFTSQFYRDSWDIIGRDITGAVLDFFASGQLLRQVNTTTLTLIPKVKNPLSVLEYRPIACCNIIYKCITKILCSRLSMVLPDIVSCSQGGFVKGRNIVDNVLICQDLVRLYNRKVAFPRCLIKIDLRKAYDTVEWEFIHQMLIALKFPTCFIKLIMICVSSPSYSLHVNGSTFGFFQGKRGLRQGDPLSPLLFTLVMEYLSRILHVVSLQDTFRFHPMCGHIKLNHLLFADDLLMFCKGNAASIMWLLRSFSTFSTASGLCLNRDKSDIYFNGVPGDIIEDIVKISGFRIGKLPFNYLGVPISAKKISKFDSQKLIERIVARIRALGARHLSYSGRLILVRSVLSTLHSYWASLFLLPSGIMKKEEGGLGLTNIQLWNRALLAKYTAWLATKKDHLWVKWVNHVYMKGTAWHDYSPPLDCSWSWKKIVHVKDKFKQGYVGNLWLNSDKPYTAAAGYNWIRNKTGKVPWRFVCWNSLNVPKTSFIFWAAQQNRLLTLDRAHKMGMGHDTTCFICGLEPETHPHLFYKCVYSKHCILLLQDKLNIHFNMDGMVAWFSKNRAVSPLQKLLTGACYVGVTYSIWTVRNQARLFQQVTTPQRLVYQVCYEVLTRWKHRNVKPLKLDDQSWIDSISICS